MAKKYTTIGLYKKPSQEQMEKYPNQAQRAYLSVYMGKDKAPVTLSNGDILSFTKKEDKLKDLTQALSSGKIKQDTYDYLFETISHPDVLAEVVLVQK